MGFLVFLKGWAAKLGLYAVVAALFIGIGFSLGKNYQSGIERKAENKEVAQVIQKNDSLQDTADKVGQDHVVYKDRVVTEYKTIYKDVIRYVQKENSSSNAVLLPPEWVCLHDRAVRSANGETQAAAGTSGNVDACAQAKDAPVKSGDALEVITENYQAYGDAKAKAEFMKQLYEEVAEQVNK